MKGLRWDLIGTALAGITVIVALYLDANSKVGELHREIDDLKLFIDQAFHEAALDRATAADDLNYRLGFERGSRVRQFMDLPDTPDQ